MIKSMTGFGKSIVQLPNKLIIFEVKAVNSKTLDITLRLSANYRDKETAVRTFISQFLERGKIEFSMTSEFLGDEGAYSLNRPLAMRYMDELKELAKDIHETNFKDFLPIITRLPDVYKTDRQIPTDQEIALLKTGVFEVLKNCDDCRQKEGEILERDFVIHVQKILEYLQAIEPFEKERITNLRTKLYSEFHELANNQRFDENRFEQELIYYIEKLDITEEKVRLKKHCDYFYETMRSGESVGRKLGFIAQEMGREINTLGSKSNHFEMQRLVVMMKDELEKIKEQLLNIL
ncbi:MAG: YicC family protein [Bacteroidales bacterium]|nr:YicC family protein [Bacteroidales bacterium]